MTSQYSRSPYVVSAETQTRNQTFCVTTCTGSWKFFK